MSSMFEDAERRILAALLLDWHRPGDRLIGTKELLEDYSSPVDQKLFDGVVADFDQQGIALVVYDKDGAAAVLKPNGYKAAFTAVSRELGDPETLMIHWAKEEIVSEAPAPDWFPVPIGWKWLQILPKAPAPAFPRKQEAVAARPVDWQKWGVIFTAVGTVLTLIVMALLDVY